MIYLYGLLVFEEKNKSNTTCLTSYRLRSRNLKFYTYVNCFFRDLCQKTYSLLCAMSETILIEKYTLSTVLLIVQVIHVYFPLPFKNQKLNPYQDTTKSVKKKKNYEIHITIVQFNALKVFKKIILKKFKKN